MFCSSCGISLPDHASICPNCKAPVRVPAADVQTAAYPVPAVPRSGFALAAAILGTLALAFCWAYCVGNAFLTDGGGVLASLFSGMIVQFVVLTVAVACNWVGYASRTRGLVLTAGILYCVASALYLLLMVFLVLPLIFAFIGYTKMRPRP